MSWRCKTIYIGLQKWPQSSGTPWLLNCQALTEIRSLVMIRGRWNTNTPNPFKTTDQANVNIGPQMVKRAAVGAYCNFTSRRRSKSVHLGFTYTRWSIDNWLPTYCNHILTRKWVVVGYPARLRSKASKVQTTHMCYNWSQRHGQTTKLHYYVYGSHSCTSKCFRSNLDRTRLETKIVLPIAKWQRLMTVSRRTLESTNSIHLECLSKIILMKRPILWLLETWKWTSGGILMLHFVAQEQGDEHMDGQQRAKLDPFREHSPSHTSTVAL